MDPATVIALCKENIQPLRHGRNATQLGTALRAQDDVEAQQLLQQEKQMYEDTIKNYVGDDPLENWFDYISWVEQSFPKSGHESPLARLLQQCLTNFEKEVKYHQDQRFIRLWINYISMQKNPLELYQLLYNNGIGTMVADLYRAWAFELEQVEDFKRADEVYMIGMGCRAEPKEELDYAHKNFQLAVARKMLGRNDDRNEISVAEQRQAFSSLKAIKAGRRVGSIRTGHRVRDYMPGAVPQQTGSMNQAQKPNAGIQIYQDDAPGDMKGSSILDHVPIDDAVHKENTIKPGPWNNNHRKCPLVSSAVKPSFKVHEDTEVINMDKIRLFPNHISFYDDSKYEEFVVPVFVPDVPNPNIILKPQYPKELVYANNMDRSLEEIKAQKYLESRRQNNQQPSNGQMQEANGLDQHSITKANDLRHQIHHDSQLEELERQTAERLRLEQQQREAELERQRLIEQQQREAELERQRQIEQQQREAELERQRQQQQRLQQEQMENLQRVAELKRQMMYEAEQNELKRLEAERLQQQQQQQHQHQQQQHQQSLHNSSYMSTHHSSTTDEQHLLGQSMTVNTKEAISAVQDLWQSPSSNSSRMMTSPIVHRMQSESRNKISFDIHMDSSMTQNVVVSNKLHHQQQQQQSFGPVPVFNDQENHHFHNSYSNHEHQNSYGNHSVAQNSYHLQNSYSMQPHHEQHLQPPQQQPHLHHAQHHPQHLQSSHHHQALMQQQQQQQHQQPHHPQHHQVSPHMPPPHQLSHHQTSQHGMLHQSPPQHHAAAPQHHYPHMQLPVQHMQPPDQQHHMQHPQLAAQQQQHMNTSQHINTSQHMNTSQHLNASQHMNASQHLNNSQHLQHHPHQHQQPHMQHPQHIQHAQQVAQQQQQQQQPQHHMYHHVPNTMGYPVQPYVSPPQSAHTSIEQPQKQAHYSGYVDPAAAETSAGKPLPYRMPTELPHIKSPGMNRRDLKYLENAENKENAAVGLDYNGALDESVIKQQQQQHLQQQQQQQDENNLYIDESLGISPLPGVNETCYTETFNRPLIASTPMTNHFKAYKPPKDVPQQPQHQQEQQHQLQQQQQQQHQQQQHPQQHQLQHPHSHQQLQYPSQPAAPQPPAQTMPGNGELGEKLSVIMESTREYVSSSSASSGTTRMAFTITRDDLPTIKEQSTIDDTTTNNYLGGNTSPYEQQQQHAAYEQKMRAEIQAVHAQSPRTVQRNVDQITSEIKTNCDLRKSISFNGEATTPETPTLPELDDTKPVQPQQQPDSSMDCEYHEPMEQVEEEPVKEEPPFELPEGDINPFDKNLISGLLRRMKFPQSQHADGYVKLTSNLIKFVPSSTITLGNDMYDLDKCLGKGTYGTVFKGTDLQTRRVVALKTQKPAWVWEYYIAREIKTRLTNPHMLRGFMDVQTSYIADNGSVLVSEFSKYGTLLEVTNKIKISTGKPLSEPLAIFFTIEMLQIVEYLHKCQIIHADIKPDNFLLMHMPSEDVRPTIQLIDFGCSIDMNLFPEGTKFSQIIKTEDFTCIEMQTGKPWTYQTDLYCLAASSHCLLFGNYMRVSVSGKKWYINSKLPRYAKKAVWEKYFTDLLNIESCENLPELAKLRNLMEEALAQMPELQTKYRQFSNVLNHR